LIAADAFLGPARERGFDFYTGVPCSFLTPFINRAISSPEITYVGAASEGEAVGIAAGAWLAGRGTVVMCQNSGLGNCVNPLTSLNYPFRIPTLLITTWRGQPGVKDEPQHELMSQITHALLETMRVRARAFPKTVDDVGPALDAAEAVIGETSLPFGFVMERGAVADVDLDQLTPTLQPEGTFEDCRAGGSRPARIEILERFLAEVTDDTAVIATTGKCGRELFTLADRPQHLYQVGSMGCASAMALGVALNVDRPVTVLDGDGAALMKMGAFATLGAYGPKNLIHVVLDNGVHDSTGGQATVSPHVEFAKVALACGYRSGTVCDDPAGFAAALHTVRGAPGPHLIHVRIAPGSIDNLGRPTIPPADVARRFRDFVTGG
jgi:phosphonopyruvate decarboxylase